MEIILWGGTGQARVVRPIVEAQANKVVCVFDNSPTIAAPFSDVAFGGDWSGFQQWHTAHANNHGFVVCIGGARGHDRVEVSRRLMANRLIPVPVTHHRSWVASSARLGLGCQILAMAAVCENVQLGDFSIINTSATIDHDTTAGLGLHVMPGATIAGDVKIGDYVTIGSNATVLPRLVIGDGVVVGAGAVVTRDVPDGAVVVGCPARPIESR